MVKWVQFFLSSDPQNLSIYRNNNPWKSVLFCNFNGLFVDFPIIRDVELKESKTIWSSLMDLFRVFISENADNVTDIILSSNFSRDKFSLRVTQSIHSPRSKSKREGKLMPQNWGSHGSIGSTDEHSGDHDKPAKNLLIPFLGNFLIWPSINVVKSSQGEFLLC